MMTKAGILQEVYTRIYRTMDLRLEPHPIDEKDFTESNPLASEILKYGREIVI